MKRKFTVKTLLLLLTAAMTVTVFSGCSETKSRFTDENKLHIAATLFPQYDFARQIGGDRAEVIKLLPAGVESHSYEPTARDIVAIGQADLFLYTGAEMEPWAQTVLKGTDGKVKAVDLSEGVSLLHSEEEHDHDGEEEHEEEIDPHIWTAPKNAKRMVSEILAAMVAADPEGEAYYTERANAYDAELDKLDAEFADIAKNGADKPLIFGGRFAFLYLAKEYGFTWQAAYNTCSADSEPSAAVISALIDTVREKGISVVFYEEMTDPKLARTVSEATGAELLLLHSCHNVTTEELSSGATYLSLMQTNAENIRKALL